MNNPALLVGLPSRANMYSNDICTISVLNSMSVDDFIPIYIRYIMGDKGVSAAELSVIVGCIKHSQYTKQHIDANIIYLDDNCIREIIGHYKFTTGRMLAIKTIDNTIAKLTKDGIIVKGNGYRYINNKLFKGDINKFAKVSVQFIADFVIDDNENI